MIGSKDDEMCRDDIEDEYNELSKIVHDATIEMFDNGNHLLILSRAIEVADSIKRFIHTNDIKMST
ncbi:hypothetical protein EDD63_12211 [Breznakia blatticola]|uniref:Uncharacterized protein n=1 Tax=Breznakia blatticola TaxID=1754012 RepID=A0A4R7ZFY4_9FIRM|nr:hypothetical protein [Breznakia blatticola]TDW16529.1 hypothetical protein EDD63_12211 [Breznakia blatticola]